MLTLLVLTMMASCAPPPASSFGTSPDSSTVPHVASVNESSSLRPFFVALALLVVGFLSVAPALALASTPSERSARSEDQGGVGIRLVDIPAASQDDPRARSYIVDNLPPGTTIARRVHVSNSTSSAQHVSVYAGAARIDEGSFAGEEGATVNELTTWTSIDQPQLELPAGEGADVLVTVAVPGDAPEGEQYAAVWAEVRSDAAPNATIVTATRVGVRMYVSVGPGNGPPADFEVTALAAGRSAAGHPKVTATVTNTGGRALDISGALTLSKGPSGLSAGPFPTKGATTVAPGAKSTVDVALGSDLPNGPWRANLELKSGLVVRDASAQLTFPDAGEGLAITPDKGPNVVWISIGIGVILALAATAIVWRRRAHAGVTLRVPGREPRRH